MYIYIYIYIYIERERERERGREREGQERKYSGSRIVPIPPFGISSKACIHSDDWQPYHHNWQHIYLMYIILSCTSLIIKECPASTHNLCQSNVKHSVLKQVCMHSH